MNRRDFVGTALPLFALGTGAATAQPPGGTAPATPEKPPLARDDAEKKILAVLDEMDRKQRKGSLNVPAEDGRLLRILTEFSGARQVVELGTSNGYSAIWFGLALRKTGGQLTTYEINEERIKLAKANFQKAGVDGLITVIAGDAHETVKRQKGPLDLVFIDADKTGYLDYLKKLKPLVRPGGLIVAHNMARPKPDPDFVQAITTDKDLETVFLHMHAAGLALSLKKR
jgi:predicted O-methyltransferase YrrM